MTISKLFFTPILIFNLFDVIASVTGGIVAHRVYEDHPVLAIVGVVVWVALCALFSSEVESRVN